MWPDKLGIDVSHETLEKLKIYHTLLLKWQRAINLVSPKTLDEAWVRHFADSAQLAQHVSRESRRLVDIGSGAGFPGAVLAIMCPWLEVHCVESDSRKCQFLKTVSRETGVNIIVHNARIESCIESLDADIVSARALSSLSELLKYVEPLVLKNADLMCLFMKGESVKSELEEARENFTFSCEQYPSLTDSKACILALSKIRA